MGHTGLGDAWRSKLKAGMVCQEDWHGVESEEAKQLRCQISVVFPVTSSKKGMVYCSFSACTFHWTMQVDRAVDNPDHCHQH
jgi:hypothetical protein